MTISSSASVIIAGSGPTGLVLALACCINGISVRLIDRELDHRVGSKGAGIMPRAMEMYRFLGVLDDIKDLASELVPMRRYQADGRQVDKEWDFFEVWPSTPDFPYGETLVLAQDVIERVLRENLQRRFGVVVELGTELIGFEQSSEHVVAHLKRYTKERTITSEETVCAEYLVGTDGGRSTVRKGLGLEFVGETRSKDCWIYGDVELTGLGEGVWHMFGDMSTKTILFRPPVKATPNRWAVLAAGRDNESPDRLGGDHEAFEQYVREVTNRDDIKISRYHYLTAHRSNIRMCRTFGKGGRVFIAGDAAHTHPATGGQGLNSSVQDSFNLAWKLALVVKGLSSPKLLETYSVERVPVIEEMLSRTTALFEGAVKTKDTIAARDDVSAWKRPRILQQLGIHYEWSPIVYDDRFEGGRAPAPLNAYGGGTTHEVRAGDRAPDAPALEVANARHTMSGMVALFDIYGSAKHTILLFVTRHTRQEELEAFFAIARQQPAGLTQTVLVVEKEHPQPKALQSSDTVVIDTEGHVFQSYGIADARRAAVVRPDGIVGAMVGSADGLSHYFGLIFDVTK